MIEELIEALNTPEKAPQKTLEVPFSEAIWPWMTVARRRLKEATGNSLCLLSTEALFSMELFLLKRWSKLCSPCFFSEMQIKKIEFVLQGNSSRERYLDYIDKSFLDKFALRSFFEEYKELARLVVVFLQFWVEHLSEFLLRLEADLIDISKVFNESRNLGKIEQLQLDVGDTHHGGRSVIILTFTCGKSLVYKPKNIQIVEKFHSYIHRLIELGLKTPLKTYQVLPKGEYGWEEKVEQMPCLDLGSVERYYEKAGTYLCLLYLLDGTDLHYNNIIASGENPILIDLETIFHSKIKNFDKELTDEMLGHSVLSIGLLPYFLFDQVKGKGRDISGLGFEAAQISQSKWIHVGTDEMKLDTQVHTIQRSPCQVLYNQLVMNVSDYVDFIISGFKETYLFVKQHRDLLEKEGWLTRLGNNPVRILLRPTRFYAHILQNLYSPDAILDADFREKELSLLNITFGKVRNSCKFIVAEEKRALIQGDIPAFNTFPFTTDLFSKDFLIASHSLESQSLQTVIQRHKNMSEENRRLQETFIRHAFYAKNTDVHKERNLCSQQAINPIQSEPRDEEILNFAESIAIELRSKAYESNDGSLGWIHLEPNLDSGRYQLRTIADNLYSGRIGIALFFASLSYLSKKEKWKNEALNTLTSLRKVIDKGIVFLPTSQRLGGMVGLGSIIYGLLYIGKLLHLPILIEDAKKLIYSIEERQIQEDVYYDFISGTSGLMLVLISFYQHNPDSYVLKLAELCGHHLCQKSREILENTSDKLWLGLSHGAAGIAYALLKLAAITRNPILEQTAREFLFYERSYFSKVHKNWPHLGKNGIYFCSWCHGATGIGLARLALSSFSKDPSYLEEIAMALEITLEQIGTGSLTLCCGSLGRLEFLRELSRKGFEPYLEETIRESVNIIFSQIKQSTDEFNNLGFMQGKSGIGYSLLRLIDKEH